VSDYSCAYIRDGGLVRCTWPQNHGGPHKPRDEDLADAPGATRLWGKFGLSYAGFWVISERQLHDLPSKVVKRLAELYAEMPQYLLYHQPKWRARAVDERGRMLPHAEHGKEHSVWCRSAMCSMYDLWQDEVADLMTIVEDWAPSAAPGYQIQYWVEKHRDLDTDYVKEGTWRSVKRMNDGYTNYRHHRWQRRLVGDLEAFQFRARQWSAKTFPGQSEQSMIDHLRDEVNNEVHVGCDAEELADVGLLLLALAGRRGISLSQAMHRKHELCRNRKWHQDAGKGFPGHVKEGA